MLINYDKYSLIIDNKRTVIKSAALHYFRTPGEAAWRDRLSKLKAAGYNAVDIYFCWGYHSTEQGVYDFTGIKDIRILLNIAEELGLFVIARPGPYINAELSLGGLPIWLLDHADMCIRNKKDGDFVYCETFMTHLKEWYSRIIPIINEYHNIIAFQIENEYFTNEAEPDYIQELYDMSRSMGVRAPIFHNDVLGVGLYSDIVNIYAFDTYPSINMLFDWRDFPDSFQVLDNAENNIAGCCCDSPLFVAELQAGWYDKWHGTGYKHIRKLFGREHINIVTKTALSQGITMFNHYMGCGGTSWSQLSSCETYTSYDFSAPVSEEGIPQDNYFKAKEINYFLNAFNLSSTDLEAEGEDITGANEENTFARLRKDNINNCKWLYLRNLNKESRGFNVIDGNKAVIKPFDMVILPVELDLKACRIDFSGMSIFAKVENDDKEIILVLISPENYIKIDGVILSGENLSDFSSRKFLKDGKMTKIIFITESTADKTWVVDNKIIIGPDFLTNNMQKAAFSDNADVKIIDINQEHCINIQNLLEPISIKVPIVHEGLYFNASPEIDMMYDYSDWNYIEDNRFDCISNKVYDDYIWYKGSFMGHLDFIEIHAKHCYAVFLNGKQIFSLDSLKYEEGDEIQETIAFNIDKDDLSEKGLINELTVLVQNLGFDRGFQNELRTPRGIISLKTFPEKDIKWQIRGGLTPVLDDWFSVAPEHIEETSENSYILFVYSTFHNKNSSDTYVPLMLDMSEFMFDKADIYLNGVMIGRYWKNKSPQDTFYLPEAFLQEKNIISLIIWEIKPKNFCEKGCENFNDYVKIKIRNNKSYKLVPLKAI